MKNFLLALFLMPILSGMAQVTINQQDLPQPGDTFMLYVDKTPVVTLGTASPTQQNWNWAALGNDSTKYATYGFTSSLSFASSFPGSNSYTYGPAVLYGGPGSPSPGAGVGYTMWAVNSTGMWVIGYRSNYDGTGEKNILTNPNELLMPVPCIYGLNQTDNSTWEVNINYIQTDYDTLYRSRTGKTFTCDAWGSMTTPLGSFSGVLRVKEFSVKIDSVFIKSGPVTLYSMEWSRDTSFKYYFWSPQQRHPVATAYCTNSGVLSRVEYVSWAQQSAPNTSRDILQILISPNPADEYIFIKMPPAGNIQPYTIVISDISGRAVYSQESNLTEIYIPAQKFNNGVYSLKVMLSSGESIRSRLIINHK